MLKPKSLSTLFGAALIAFSGLASACGTASLTTPTASAETAPDAPFVEKSDPNEPIIIAAVGDIMLGSTSINDSFLPPNDGREMLKEVTAILSAADVTFGNLEGPLLEGGVSEKCPPPKPAPKIPLPKTTPAADAPKPVVRCFAFRVPVRYGKYLKDAGFDVLSLANNHASDFGDYGRVSTRKTLDELGIKHAGSDRQRFAATVLEVKGRRVAFIGFAHNNVSFNVNELETARRAISELTKKADLVVVSFHGGAEGAGATRVPNETEIFVGEKRGNLRAFARAAIDAGADLVLGHGPHVLRGMEIYKDRLVVYSMGNFATYGMFNLKGPQGVTGIFEITLGADGKFAGGKIHAARQTGRGIPVLDKSGEALKILRQLSTADFGANAPKIADDGVISAK